MESFYRWLAKMANKKLDKYDLKRRPAQISNELMALSGQMHIGFEDTKVLLATEIDKQISEYWRSNGDTLVARFLERFLAGVAPRMSDQVVVIKEVLDEGLAGIKENHVRTNTSIHSLVGRLMGNVGALAGKAERRQNVIMQSFEEMCRQAAINEQNNGDRYLQLYTAIQRLEKTINHNATISQGMQVRFFENLTYQLQMMSAKPKDRFDSMPKIEWVFDNIDLIADLGASYKAALENDAPRSTMKMRMLSALRSMSNLKFGHMDIRKELDRLFDGIDNAQSLAA